ncbi:MAG: GDP-mannose 4,6-dehydratase [Planctomycetaceae bacterium]|nr:MAG: GDP-mannose 4,6-dehydratase [Planctomycetaceae bacterium]
MTSALITGITGQDGSYLTELLLAKGYQVHGIVRRSSSTVRQRLDHLTSDPDVYGSRLFLHYAELEDVTTVRRILQKTRPAEFYHLAGQSHVGTSFEVPESTCEFSGMGTLRLLEILRDLDNQPKFLHASSSEIFGRPQVSPQDESTPMNPVTPYGVAKAFATQMVRLYRESYGIFSCNAICFNHESPRRGESFVTRKITRSAARIRLGLQTELALGNLDGRRDWGFAGDYVDAMWRSLQAPTPNDYVIATGQVHSVREVLQMAFDEVELNWQDHVVIDPKFIRPADVELLVGDPSRARERLGWKPLQDLATTIRQMVRADLEITRKELAS